MDIQIVDNETVTEPITLSEAKAYLQIDADYATDDNAVTIALITARKRLEAYINIGLVRREVIVFWDGRPIELPLSPTGDITEVKSGDDVILSDAYTVIPMPAKRIAINAASCLSGNWWYSLNGYVEFTPTQGQTQAVYQCKYETGYEVLPADLKQAILAETNYIFNLKGSPVTDLISPNAAMLANSYSRNLVL